MERDLHSEGASPGGRSKPNATEPHNTENRLPQATDNRCDAMGPPFCGIRPDSIVVGDDAAGESQHQADCMIGDFGCSVIRHIEDSSTVLTPRFDVNAIKADPGPNDRTDVWVIRGSPIHICIRRRMYDAVYGLAHLGRDGDPCPILGSLDDKINPATGDLA